MLPVQMFFALMSAVLIGVKYKSDKRDQYLHHGGWLVKLALWLAFCILPFFFPVGLVNAYCKSGPCCCSNLVENASLLLSGSHCLYCLVPVSNCITANPFHAHATSTLCLLIMPSQACYQKPSDCMQLGWQDLAREYSW
jgi:hypothetical protein